MGVALDGRAGQSLASAGSLLGGLVLGQGAVSPAIGAACALGGVALALPRLWRSLVLALALGLGLSWFHPELATRLPPGVSADRPVLATVHQRGAWRQTRDGWQVEVEVELLRQRGVIAAWPAKVRLYVPLRLPGSRWSLRGYLRRSPRLRNGVAERPSRWRLTTKSGRLAGALEDGRLGVRALDRLWRVREVAQRRVALAGGSHPGGALAQALVLGNPKALSEDAIEGLRRVGLAHVTALSGLHLGVLAVWASVLLRWAPARWRWSLVVGVTLAYLALGGGRPSLARAWLMVAAAGSAIVSGRSTRSIHALTWSAVGLAALEPSAVGEVGFRLTFLASAGVIWGGRLLSRLWAPRLGSLARPLGATLGAQLATMPITLAAFRWLPLWAWCWNLVLVPVVALAVPLSFAWVAVAAAAPTLAAPLVLPLDWIAGVIEAPGALPAGLLGGIPWGRGLAAAVGLTVALGAWFFRPRVCLVPTMCLLLLSGPSIGPPDDRTTVHFIDVGQGDAMLIRDGEGALLVDGGGGRGRGIAQRALLPVLGAADIDEIEVAVLSHGDIDHCRGLLELARYVRLREIWLAPAAAGSDCGRTLLLRPGIRVRPLWAGGTTSWRGWSFSVLSPGAGARGGNEESLALIAASRGRRLLLTGDIGHRTEFEIVQRTPTGGLQADLLKVAHHGSAGSSSLSFLRAVRPRLAVLSVGRRNPFGHPARRVLERLKREGIVVLRTDLAGQVEVGWGDGTPLRVRTPGSGE